MHNQNLNYVFRDNKCYIVSVISRLCLRLRISYLNVLKNIPDHYVLRILTRTVRRDDTIRTLNEHLRSNSLITFMGCESLKALECELTSTRYSSWDSGMVVSPPLLADIRDFARETN